MMSYGEAIVDGVKYGFDLWKLSKIRKKRRREPNLKSASVTRGIKKILMKNNGKTFILEISISLPLQKP